MINFLGPNKNFPKFYACALCTKRHDTISIMLTQAHYRSHCHTSRPQWKIPGTPEGESRGVRISRRGVSHQRAGPVSHSGRLLTRLVYSLTAVGPTVPHLPHAFIRHRVPLVLFYPINNNDSPAHPPSPLASSPLLPASSLCLSLSLFVVAGPPEEDGYKAQLRSSSRRDLIIIIPIHPPPGREIDPRCSK